MRTIIAGSRTALNYQDVLSAVHDLPWKITEVVSGTARGADLLGERWARENNVPVKRFPANWDLYGKRAGYLRNEEMADYAEALIALWDGKSVGTKHMINIAFRKGLRIVLWRVQ